MSTTYGDALTKLGLTENNESANSYSLAGQLPGSLTRHVPEKTYHITGLTPNDFIKKHGATAFDMADLAKKFKKICTDFNAPLNINVASRAVEFCSKMIYEVGPEARKVDKRHADKIWKFFFMYKDGNKCITRAAYVSTYKHNTSSYVQEYEEGVKITLSVKSASLLAVMTLEKLNELAVAQTPAVFLLTPLAGAVFSKEDIPAMAALFENCTPTQMVKFINARCQSGDHYLENSKIYIAAIAAIVATRNVKDRSMRYGIVGKTLKQYLNADKISDVKKFEVLAGFGHGGVPSDMSPDKLIAAYDTIRKISPRSISHNVSQSQLISTVYAPGTSSGRPTSPSTLVSGSPDSE